MFGTPVPNEQGKCQLLMGISFHEWRLSDQNCSTCLLMDEYFERVEGIFLNTFGPTTQPRCPRTWVCESLGKDFLIVRPESLGPLEVNNVD